MVMTVNLDKAGRIVLPKALRDALHLSPGDTLDLTVEGEQVTLQPRRNMSPLLKEQGVWVLHTGEPLKADAIGTALRNIRQRRAARNTGSTT